MEHQQRVMALSVLQMMVGVYVSMGAISEGEALRIALVLKDSGARALLDQTVASQMALARDGGL